MHKISDKLFVSAQLSEQDIHKAKASGVCAIINNRPDGEEPSQPAAAAMREVAAREGMAYAHIPVAAGQITQAKVRAFQEALAETNAPVLAHCKTGTRSAMLHVIGEAVDGRMSRTDIAALGDRLGMDLSGAINWLDANGH